MKKISLIFMTVLLSTLSYGQIPTTDLIKEYFLTNGSLENNVTPGIYDLIPTGSARTIIPDVINTSLNALSLNGDELNGGVRAGATNGVGSADMTLSFWIKTSTNTANETMVSKQYENGTFGAYGWKVMLINGKIRVTDVALLNGSIISNTATTESNFIADGNWHHITCIVERVTEYVSGFGWSFGPKVSIYQDCDFINTHFIGGASSVGLVYLSRSNAEVKFAPDAIKYADSIDNIRVYNRALTALEIKELCKEYIANLPILYVDENATGGNNGSSWNDAFTTLRNALALVNDGQDLWVAAGTYTPDPTDRMASFTIPSGVSVYGGFNGTETLLSQRDWTINNTTLSGDLLGNDAGAWAFINTLRNDNSYHVVKMMGTNPTLDGVTISDGHANGSSQWDIYGAGIYLNYYTTTPIIKNCTLENNIADVAAAMFTRFGTGSATVIIENSIFRKNMARLGACYSGVTNGATTLDVNVSNCLFTENVAQDKSAGDGYAGSAFIQQTNSTGANVTAILSNCTFTKNQDLGTNALMNSTTRSVVGLSQAAGTQLTAELHNCIFWGNTEVGGVNSKAISNHLTAYTLPQPLSIKNSFDDDNFSNMAPGDLTNTSNTDPLFTDYANNDYTLSCLSPAVDAGDATGLTLPATDLAGNGRIINTIDLGCYELLSYASITAVTQGLTINLDAGGNATITANDVNNNSGSTCGTAFTLALDQTTFTCADLGPNTVTLTATETVGGASDNATATITVVDNNAPTVVSQNITVQLDAAGNATITPADINNGSFDNCTAGGSLVLSLDITTFTCADIGANNVLLSVDDGNGNVSSGIATVTVEDNISPISLAQNITVSILPNTTSVTINAAMIDNGSTDNCSITMSLSQTEFTCSDAGDNNVTLTVTDDNGNISTIDATVTVTTSISQQTVTPLVNSMCGNQSTNVLTGSSEVGVDYYLYDDQNNIIDGPTTGTGGPLTFITGVITNTTTYSVVAEEVPTPGDSYGLDFDGINDKVITTYSLVSGVFTIEAWIKPTAATYSRILSNYPGAGSVLAGDLVLDTYDATFPGTSLRLVIGGVGNVQSIHSQANCLTLNAWNHIAVMFNNGAVILYVNSVAVNTSTAPFTWMPSNVDHFHIGEDNPTGAASDYFKGQMDEIRFWSVARSAAEIANNKDNCLTGTELGLEAYYDFEAQGNLTAIQDITANNNGYMYNMDYNTDYIIRDNGFICNSQSCAITMSQTATVTVEDILAPVADNASLSDLTSSCEITSLTAPTATDNCIGFMTGTHTETLPITTSTTILWTYDDGNGNVTTQNQAVILNSDLTLDNASLSGITAQCEVTSLTSPTASGCTGTVVGTHGEALPLTGNTTITWSFDDGNGNTTSQTQTVVINDNTAPVLDNASLSGINSECEITSLTAPTATDNCIGTITGTHNVTLPLTSSTTITWSYVDGNGNTSSQTQNVVINDVTAPIVDLVSLAGLTAQCEITSLTAPTATDNCIGTITGTHNATLPLTTNQTITWTYDDGNGNSTSQTQSVVIDDVTAPVPDVTTLPDVNGICEVLMLNSQYATDNCIGLFNGTHDATFPITVNTTVTWTYDDGNGNVTTQTQDVIINDAVAPIVDNAVLTDLLAACEITSLTAPTATDNCAGFITGAHNVTLPITTSLVITWSYDDGNGNITTQDQNVIINDNIAPIADLNTLANINEQCDVVSLTAPTATDNCAGTLTGTHDATFPITSNTLVTWSYDDGNGNITTQTQQVNVNDNTAPVTDVNTLSDINEQCDIVSLTAPTATDNCAGALTGTHDATFPITSNTLVTWSYDDGNGNIVTQTQQVNVNDNIAPVTDVATLTSIVETCEVTTLVAPLATDNCSGALTGTHTMTLPITSNTSIMWTYTDAAGNITTQDQDVILTGVDAAISLAGITISANEANADSYQWVDCDNNNAAINGAMSSTFTPTSNGNYAVEVTIGSCTEISACESITTVGIEELESHNIILIPNPTLKDVTIQSEANVIDIQIIDILGAIVRIETTTTFSVGDLSPGVYMLVIRTDNGTVNKRLIKQ
ncbi:MAG: T9SS type A sorting domain-containing protein [Fluviicola sp.]|nr:T9SS type A sorting domain-containing protein [Fluviicola sp.]